jgi:hypothetical protein
LQSRFDFSSTLCSQKQVGKLSFIEIASKTDKGETPLFFSNSLLQIEIPVRVLGLAEFIQTFDTELTRVA